MNKQAARFTGSIPQYYDRFLGPVIFHQFAQDLARRIADLKPSSVLELAAGTGIATRKLRDQLPASCTLTATDLNSPMLEVASAKFSADESIQFSTADATALSYRDEKFDAIACQFGVMFFPDKQRAYEEALRVLIPGGHYIFNVWGGLDENPFACIAHEAVSTFFPEDPPGFYRVPFSYHDAETIVQSLTNAGFSSIETETINTSSDFPSAADFATGLVFGNPLFEEVLSRGGDPEQVSSVVAQALENTLGKSTPLQAMVIVARK